MEFSETITPPNLENVASMEESKVSFNIRGSAEKRGLYLTECSTYNLRVSTKYSVGKYVSVIYLLLSGRDLWKM